MFVAKRTIPTETETKRERVMAASSLITEPPNFLGGVGGGDFVVFGIGVGDVLGKFVERMTNPEHLKDFISVLTHIPRFFVFCAIF